jgi:hypothetical protein
MSYVDAYLDQEHDVLHVVERVDGKRIFKEFPVNYTAYYDDHNGKFETIYGRKVSRVKERSKKKFNRELKLHNKRKTYEADMNWTFRVLEENYLEATVPELHMCFFDIEVDFDPEKGFAPPTDTFAPITSIAVYLSWMESLITLALPPETLTMEQAKKEVEGFDNVWLYTDEGEMLSNPSTSFFACSIVNVSGGNAKVIKLSIHDKYTAMDVIGANVSVGGANPFSGSKSTSISKKHICNSGTVASK